MEGRDVFTWRWIGESAVGVYERVGLIGETERWRESGILLFAELN